MLGNDHEAEDVVQETYLRAFPKLGEFREGASLAALSAYRRGAPSSAAGPNKT